MRKIARVDSNQKKIVAGLRKLGVSVLHTHQLGSGAPDIICGKNKRNYLFELKDGDGELTPDEKKFHKEWRGAIWTVRTLEEAVQIILN